jgi:hypothetical protein
MDLQNHFEHIHNLIRKGRVRALKTAYEEQLNVYWSVGAYVVHRLTNALYGEKVVEQLAEWLKEKEPLLKGFDRRSIYRMREFYEIWNRIDWNDPGNTNFEIVESLTPQFQNADNQSDAIVGFLNPQLRLFLKSLLRWAAGGQRVTKGTYRQLADGPLRAVFLMSYAWEVEGVPVAWICVSDDFGPTWVYWHENNQ